MKYNIYQSDLVKENQEKFINECVILHDVITSLLNIEDTTWNFYKYNTFIYGAGSVLFYNLFKELNHHIRSYIDDDRPLWLQSWINYHPSNKLEKELERHVHLNYSYHGYISIDPKDTTTVFDNYEIKNKIGQIYMGPTGRGYEHYVRLDKPYIGNRITIAFDIIDKPNQIIDNKTFIPIL